MLARQGAGARQDHATRVAVCATDAEFVVQVRSGRQPGAADVTDDLALLNAAAVAEPGPQPRHVAVQRLVRRAVLEYHDLPVAALPSGERDATVAGRLDRRAGR